jgi:hypothetical protein
MGAWTGAVVAFTPHSCVSTVLKVSTVSLDAGRWVMKPNSIDQGQAQRERHTGRERRGKAFTHNIRRAHLLFGIVYLHSIYLVWLARGSFVVAPPFLAPAPSRQRHALEAVTFPEHAQLVAKENGNHQVGRTRQRDLPGRRPRKGWLEAC